MTEDQISELIKEKVLFVTNDGQTFTKFLDAFKYQKMLVDLQKLIHDAQGDYIVIQAEIVALTTAYLGYSPTKRYLREHGPECLYLAYKEAFKQ